MKNIALVIIALAAAATLGIMASTTSGPTEASDILFLVGLYLWVSLPFVVLALLNFYIHRRQTSKPSAIAILLTTVAVSTASVWLYWTSVYQSASSTSSLVFLFLPIYSLVSIAVLYGLALLLFKFVVPANKV